MPYDLLSLYLKLPVFMLVASRLGGLIMFQPVLGALAIPFRVRLLLVIGLAAMVTPFTRLPTAAPHMPAGIVLAMGGEILLGAVMGLAVTVCFLGLQMGGLLIAQESGLAFGQIADPQTGKRQSILSMFYLQLAAVVYLIVGGHRAMVAACLDTFQTIPLLSEPDTFARGVDLLFDALAVGGEVAVRVAAPAVLTLFLVNIALGFISRTVPQLNVITIGFSLKALVGFVLMAISLPSAIVAFTGALDRIVGWIGELAGP